jgi:hypothetical protein
MSKFSIGVQIGLVLVFLIFVALTTMVATVLVLEYFSGKSAWLVFFMLCTSLIVHNSLLKVMLDDRDPNYMTRLERSKAIIPIAVLTTAMLTYGLGLSGFVFAMIFIGIPTLLSCKD